MCTDHGYGYRIWVWVRVRVQDHGSRYRYAICVMNLPPISHITLGSHFRLSGELKDDERVIVAILQISVFNY